MNKKFKIAYNTSLNSFKINNEGSISDMITAKSNNIKAALKSKYFLYKLEKEFFNKKFD